MSIANDDGEGFESDKKMHACRFISLYSAFPFVPFICFNSFIYVVFLFYKQRNDSYNNSRIIIIVCTISLLVSTNPYYYFFISLFWPFSIFIRQYVILHWNLFILCELVG